MESYVSTYTLPILIKAPLYSGSSISADEGHTNESQTGPQTGIIILYCTILIAFVIAIMCTFIAAIVVVPKLWRYSHSQGYYGMHTLS